MPLYSNLGDRVRLYLKKKKKEKKRKERKKKRKVGWAQWLMPVIPALQHFGWIICRQGLETSLVNMVKPCLY